MRFTHEACISYLRMAAEELGVERLTVAAYNDFASRQTLTPEAWPFANDLELIDTGQKLLKRPALLAGHDAVACKHATVPGCPMS